MRRILAGTLFMALAGTLSIAAPRQDHGDHHDNGKHKGWDNPHNPHANWNSDHDRIRPGRSYPYGRYEHVRSEFIARRMDFRTRRPRRVLRRALEFAAPVDTRRRNESAGRSSCSARHFFVNRTLRTARQIGTRSSGTMNWMPGICLECRRMSFVMKRSTPAVAAQASWMASGARRERSLRTRA